MILLLNLSWLCAWLWWWRPAPVCRGRAVQMTWSAQEEEGAPRSRQRWGGHLGDLKMHVYIRVCLHISTHTCIHIYIYIYIHTHTDCSPLGSSVSGIFQARILEWIAISFPRGSFQPKDWILVSWVAGRCFTVRATREARQFSSVAQLCPTLCSPMDCSTPGFTVHHQLPELAQTHVCWVGDAIQPCHPLSSPSAPAFNLSQHQGLFQWVSSSHQVAKVLEFQLQHWSFQWIFRTDFL